MNVFPETWPICGPPIRHLTWATRGSTVLLVDTDELTIGRFGRLCGLSVHTLRHYDDVGLLTRHASTSRRATATTAPSSSNAPATSVRCAGPTSRSRTPARSSTTPTRAEPCSPPTATGSSASAPALGEPRRHRAVRGRRTPTTSPPTGARPVQVKLLVADLDAAAAFYIDAFGFGYEVTQRTADEDFSGFVFGRYGESDFFLVHLQTADYPGAAGPRRSGARRRPRRRPPASARRGRERGARAARPTACRVRRPCGTRTPTSCGSTRGEVSRRSGRARC